MKTTYRHEKNISRVFEIYEHLFNLRQGDSLVEDHYTTFRELLDELDVCQPLVADVNKMRQYRDELAMAVYSYESRAFSFQIREQILDAKIYRLPSPRFYGFLLLHQL